MPWVAGGTPTWSIVTEQGHALYWEWNPEEKGLGPEDFLLFVRSVFPNGGSVLAAHCNHSMVWSPIEGDCFGVGLRKLRHNRKWIIAVLESPEEYPGASACPDKSLSLRANRFIAEEFLRGTSPVDLYKCDETICKENASWWQYVEKLEKVVNWKYPEAKIYRDKCASSSTEEPKESRRQDRQNRRSRYDSSYDDYQYSNRGRGSWDDYPDRSSRQDRNDNRSRSPVKRVVLVKKDEVKKAPTSVSTSERKLTCTRCNVSFEQSYELMRHYNSEQHQAALSREFPI